jgi:hypothetical protein
VPGQKTPQLCVLTQSLSTSSIITAGTKASFVIWVWSTKAASTSVLVTASVAPALDIAAPKFSACPAVSGTTCKIDKLRVGQADELKATVQVQAGATPGELILLTVAASAPGASGYSSSATDVVMLTPTNSASTPTGTFLTVPSTLPPIPGTGISPTDPSGLFPTVGTLPTTTTPGPTAKARSILRAANTASTVPLDDTLIGGQLAGLLVLFGAIALAVVRVSLRKPKENEGSSASRPSQQNR